MASTIIRSDWGCDDLRPLSPKGFSPSALLPIERVIKDRALKSWRAANLRRLFSGPSDPAGQPLAKWVFSPCIQ